MFYYVTYEVYYKFAGRRCQSRTVRRQFKVKEQGWGAVKFDFLSFYSVFKFVFNVTAVYSNYTIYNYCDFNLICIITLHNTRFISRTSRRFVRRRSDTDIGPFSDHTSVTLMGIFNEHAKHNISVFRFVTVI